MSTLRLINLGFDCDICQCLGSVMTGEDWSQICFSVFSSIDEGNNVVAVPPLAHQNKASATMTPATMPSENPNTHPIRNRSIVISSYPFRYRTHPYHLPKRSVGS